MPCVLNTVSTAEDVLRISDISISMCESPFSFPGPNELMTFFLYTLKDDTVMQGDLPPPYRSHFVTFVYPKIVVVSGGEGASC